MNSSSAVDYWISVLQTTILYRSKFINSFFDKLQQEWLGGKSCSSKTGCTKKCYGKCYHDYPHLRVVVNDLKVINIPSRVEHLSTHGSFSGPLKNLDHLVSLTFGRNFNEQLEYLPKFLRSLTFGEFFNQEANNLPPTLITLIFGGSFNRPVDNLPVSLQELTFGFQFNQKVDKLPANLKRLECGFRFNNDVRRLPSSLTSLRLGNCFAKKLTHLPEGLLSLETNSPLLLKTLPPNLTRLALRKHTAPLPPLPSSLQHLQVPLAYYSSRHQWPGIKLSYC